MWNLTENPILFQNFLGLARWSGLSEPTHSQCGPLQRAIVAKWLTMACVVQRPLCTSPSHLGLHPNNGWYRTIHVSNEADFQQTSLSSSLTFHLSRDVLRARAILASRVKTWGVSCEASWNGTWKIHGSIIASIIEWGVRREMWKSEAYIQKKFEAYSGNDTSKIHDYDGKIWSPSGKWYLENTL